MLTLGGDVLGGQIAQGYFVLTRLHARYGKQGAASALGVRVPVEKSPDMVKASLHKEFDIVSVPTPWTLIEPTQGRFVWDQVDRWMVAAKQGGRRVIAGPLLDATASGVPGWVRPMLADPAKLKDRLYVFIKEVVTRYGPINPFWNIVSSIHMNEAAALTPDAMVQVTRLAGVSVRQTMKNAKLLVEIGDPFGDIPPDAAGAIGAIRYLRALVAEAVGCRVVAYESRVQGFRCLTSTIVSKVLQLKDALAQTLKKYSLLRLYPA
jgi:hypothetical protein